MSEIPNYSNYSDSDLEQALNTVDKNEYPDIYAALLAEIAKRESIDYQPEPGSRPKIAAIWLESKFDEKISTDVPLAEFAEKRLWLIGLAFIFSVSTTLKLANDFAWQWSAISLFFLTYTGFLMTLIFYHYKKYRFGFIHFKSDTLILHYFNKTKRYSIKDIINYKQTTLDVVLQFSHETIRFNKWYTPHIEDVTIAAAVWVESNIENHQELFQWKRGI